MYYSAFRVEIRMIKASTPPTMKKKNEERMYRIPMSLWLVVASHRQNPLEVLPGLKIDLTIVDIIHPVSRFLLEAL